MGTKSFSGFTDALLKDLQTDVHSGATELARKSAKCLVAFSEQAYSSSSAYWGELVDLAQAVVAAQPSMAPPFNLVNTVLLAVEPLQATAPLETLQRATRETASQFIQRADTALEAIARHGQVLLPTSCTVFTHSSSTTVSRVLREAVREGKTVKAIGTESRPYCEGRELARSLGQQGIPTRLVLDAAIPHYVQGTDLILVGADRVSEEVFVNKIGTNILAMASKRYQVPFYVACESSKLLPAAYAPTRDVTGSSEERVQEEWQNVELLYTLFEEIPNTYLAGIITEEGVLSQNAIAKRFKTFRASRALL